MSNYCKEMLRIKDTLTGIVKAINSVINVDVTIIDSDFNRLAATGDYLGDVGCKVDASSVFSYALNLGRAFIIENPREHEACVMCNNKRHCREFAQVCCPIEVGTEIVGVIGLIAFDMDKRNAILSNRENLLVFLNRMAELIAVKVVEESQRQTLEMQSRELEILLDSMENAVFSLDEHFVVRHANVIARELLSLEIGKNADHLKDYMQKTDIDLLFKSKHSLNGHMQIHSGHKITRLLFHSQPVICVDEVCEIVLTCTNVQTLLHTFRDVVGYGSIIGFDDIIGRNKALLSTIDFSRKAASSVSTVLIQGESGTGKELFARSMHFESKRTNEPFIAVNCAAIPDNLLESELFGYEEGAFTGALKGGKIGKFEMADKGTIFLDEIGDMPLHLQAKLLRVLQEGAVERVGGRGPVQIDVRIISATNKDLEKLVVEGAFREDLFYRLNVIPIRIPSLRERKDDLELLVDIFLRRSSEMLGKTMIRVSKDVLRAFESYNWPGNVRELQNTVEFAVNMCETGVVGLDDLPVRFREVFDDPHTDNSQMLTIKELEKQAITDALNHFGRDKEGVNLTVKALGLSRATLYRKIKAYNIDAE